MCAPARLLEETRELNERSITFAKGIGHATAGRRLSEVMRAQMARNPVPYAEFRSTVERRLSELGGASEATGLFMLAADVATTAHALSAPLSAEDRHELRRLWDDLRAQ